MNLYPPELRETLSPVVALVGDASTQQLLKQMRASWPKLPRTDALGEWERIDPRFADLAAAPPHRRAREGEHAAERPPRSTGGDILKDGWWRKHALLVPAAAALLAPWRDDTPWQPIAEALVVARAQLRPGCKVLLVLVLDGPRAVEPQIGGDERLAQLMRAAALEPKGILSLRLQGATSEAGRASIQRLDRALVEAADGYYREQAKRARRMRELAIRPSSLAVRYELKAAFHAHIRRDGATAERHYSAAYGLLVELARLRFGTVQAVGAAQQPAPAASLVPPSISGASMAGIKEAAETTALQLVRLLLLAGRAAEAAEGWAWHTRVFSPLAGDKFRPFDVTRGPEGGASHWAWLTRSHYFFAQLLEAADKRASSAAARLLPHDAPPLLLRILPPALEPAYHFERAAACARERRGVLPKARALEDSALLVELLTCAYERQRALKRTRQSLLLGEAMAAEYFACSNFEMSASFYAKVLDAYRRERWHAPARQAASRLRECAIRRGRTAEWVLSALGALPRHVTADEAEAAALCLGLVTLARGLSHTPLSPPQSTAATGAVPAAASVTSAPALAFPSAATMVLPPLQAAICASVELVGALARVEAKWEPAIEVDAGTPVSLLLKLEWLGACAFAADSVHVRFSDARYDATFSNIQFTSLSPFARVASAARAASASSAVGANLAVDGAAIGAFFGTELRVPLAVAEAGSVRLVGVELVMGGLTGVELGGLDTGGTDNEGNISICVRIPAALSALHPGAIGARAGAAAAAENIGAGTLTVFPPAADASVSLAHSPFLLAGEMAPLSFKIVAGPGGVGIGAKLRMSTKATAISQSGGAQGTMGRRVLASSSSGAVLGLSLFLPGV
mmetsp:Transcript_21986/g.52151  ORF Transcript_21986/g.52151 Transcript_21986/m.52151 type:complete len:860 (-) Transcript_21986:1054-3633(-)